MKIYKCCKDLPVHSSNQAHLGGTVLSSRQTLHLFLWCGKQHLRQQDRHSCPVHCTRRTHPATQQGMCCLAQLRYESSDEPPLSVQHHWDRSVKGQHLFLKDSLPQVPPTSFSCEGRNGAQGARDRVQGSPKCI